MSEKQYTYDRDCISYEADHKLDDAYSAVHAARNMFPRNHVEYQMLDDILSRIDRASQRMASYYRIEVKAVV